ncbi:hypothetical protein D920_00272 [Enterococcus faecalis 13-SD-W-01]|nr:hypothetical protein D920_00272 [Enterococcus faecalis 13-SD-W-01]
MLLENNIDENRKTIIAYIANNVSIAGDLPSIYIANDCEYLAIQKDSKIKTNDIITILTDFISFFKSYSNVALIVPLLFTFVIFSIPFFQKNVMKTLYFYLTRSIIINEYSNLNKLVPIKTRGVT